MNTEVKTKVCWSCEGRLEDGDQRCPYCGADQKILAPAPEEGGSDSPYKLVTATKESDKPIPIPIYQPTDNEVSLKDPLQEQLSSVQRKVEPPPPEEKKPQIRRAVEEMEESVPTAANPQKAFLGSLILCMCGSTFFLFAIALVLFSQNDVLVVRWSASWWPLYLGLSVPMLFFSWRWVQQVE